MAVMAKPKKKTDSDDSGRGRPKKGIPVQVRMPEDLIEKLNQIGSVYGLDISNVVRMILHQHCGAYLPKPKEEEPQ